MKISKKAIIGSIGSSLGVMLLLVAPATAAPAFSDHLLQFIGGGATNVVDFNQGTSKIFNDSQLYISTDDWLVLKAGQEVIISNNVGVGGNTRTDTLTAVNGATVKAGGLIVSAGGAAITGNSTIAGTLTGLTGLTVNGGLATLGATTPVHIASAQTTAPTATQSMTGISATAVAGSDTKGVITTTGTASAAGTITVTFNAAYASAPVVVITPANASAVTGAAYVSSATTGTFVITTTASAAGAPSWNYHVIQ